MKIEWVNTLYNLVETLADQPITPEAARALLDDIPAEEVYAIAAGYLMEGAHDILRLRTRGIEIAAERRPRPLRVEDDLDRKYREKLSAGIGEALAKYADELRMEWTDELLAASFAVDTSGRMTTWGDASVADHRSRIDLLKTNAEANLATAGRHLQAIRTIDLAGVDTLADAVAHV